MYGIYEKYFGELGIFNFAEIAISDKPIKSLDEGLNWDGKGLYFVSWNCKDDQVCDFSKDSPIPPSDFNNLEYTPARNPEETFFLQ